MSLMVEHQRLLKAEIRKVVNKGVNKQLPLNVDNADFDKYNFQSLLLGQKLQHYHQQQHEQIFTTLLLCHRSLPT